jgi:hypothetical protein
MKGALASSLTALTEGSKLRGMKPTLLVMLLASSLAFGVSRAVAQFTPPPDAHTASIPVIDLSPSGSPLTFYGSSIPCFEWEENREVKTKAEGEYHVSNVSGRTIVAFVADTEESCMHGPGSAGPMQVDSFFGAAGIAPKEVIDFPVSMDLGMQFNGGEKPFDFTQPGTTKIVGKALWAQFDDGSQWGDRAAAEELLRRRQEAMQFYQRLLNESSDQAKLLATLQEQADPLSTQWGILQSLNEKRSQYGLPAVILMIKDKTRIGGERMATGKF